MAGAGPVSEIAAELHALEAAMVDPDRLDEMDQINRTLRRGSGRYEELDGYGLEAPPVRFWQAFIQPGK